MKNTTYNERKRLVSIDTINDMWSSLKYFCKLIDIDDEQLFSKHKSPSSGPVLNENDKPLGLQQQQKQQIKSEKKQSLSPQKYRAIDPKLPVVGPALNNCSNNNNISSQVGSPLTPQPSPNENLNANKKRNVNSRESLDGQSQAKMSKLDESTSLTPSQSKIKLCYSV